MADLTDLSSRTALPAFPAKRQSLGPGANINRSAYLGSKRTTWYTTGSASTSALTEASTDENGSRRASYANDSASGLSKGMNDGYASLNGSISSINGSPNRRQSYGYGYGAPPSPSVKRRPPPLTPSSPSSSTSSLSTPPVSSSTPTTPRSPGTPTPIPRSPTSGKHMWRRSFVEEPESFKDSAQDYFASGKGKQPEWQGRTMNEGRRVGHRSTRSKSAPPARATSPVTEFSLPPIPSTSVVETFPATISEGALVLSPSSHRRKRSMTLSSLPNKPKPRRIKMDRDVMFPAPPLHRPTPFWRHTPRSGVTASSYSPAAHLVRRSTFIAAGLSFDVPAADHSALGVEARIRVFGFGGNTGGEWGRRGVVGLNGALVGGRLDAHIY
ncbi:hypothetical protein BDZ89DRAFT_1057713 [Hymenopellis radicata]|nr:hypothetical protein BDZ89DRAFT_1057713 [Hymenopellis radicata]